MSKLKHDKYTLVISEQNGLEAGSGRVEVGTIDTRAEYNRIHEAGIPTWDNYLDAVQMTLTEPGEEPPQFVRNWDKVKLKGLDVVVIKPKEDNADRD